MSYISEQLLTSVLILNPKELNSDIDSIVRMKLKENVEGRSYEDGYIIEDSVRIIQRSMGKIVTNGKKSEIKYLIKYKAKVVSPSENDEINIIISSINKLGIIGYIRLNEGDTSEESPMLIMVPKEYFNESTRNFNDLTVGQKMDVVTVGVRSKFNSSNIQVIAKPL
jgi:DNA-directed RNA polymerase subunit E'/Rpb7|tara:strand:+ start:919 stop:1419 length:501 start_codon:yes stop_codon:yes gene_type:complete